VARGLPGQPDTRVLRLPTQQDVVLRTPGDRDVFTIPLSELASLGALVLAKTPSARRDEVKRELARVAGSGRYTRALDETLESALAPDVGRAAD
jgi:hypothetical protein